MISTKMSTLSPVYAKSCHVYILVQDFRLFSAMPKSVLLDIVFNLYIRIEMEKATEKDSDLIAAFLKINHIFVLSIPSV